MHSERIPTAVEVNPLSLLYQRELQVSQQGPEVPCRVEAHQQDDEQPHKLHPDGPGEVHPRQQQPQPPGRTEGSEGKNNVISVLKNPHHASLGFIIAFGGA